jgi:hypothetical protein
VASYHLMAGRLNLLNSDGAEKVALKNGALQFV